MIVKIIGLFLSFVIVAWGQPALFSFLAPLSAICGFALFWICCPEKKSFLSATIWFAAVQLVQLSWFVSLEFQGIYILFAYVGLSIFMGLQFGLLTLIVPKKSIKPLQILSIAACWTLFEWARLYCLSGFAFNPIGLTLSSFLLSRQTASIFGVLGLSFLVIVTNLLLYNLFFSRKKWPLVLSVVFFPYCFGLIHLYLHKPLVPAHVRVALVQTGLLPSEKIPLSTHKGDFMTPMEQWRHLIRMLRMAVVQGTVDLIVFPEAALPFVFEKPLFSYDFIHRVLCKELGSEVSAHFPPLEAPYAQGSLVTHAFIAQTLANYFHAELISGFDHHDTVADQFFNAAFHFSPHTEPLTRYDKRVLVPGEYLPFSFCRPLFSCYGISDFFTPGHKAVLMGRSIPLSVSICYEEMFSHVMREGRLLGAELFVNVTNDNWYPETTLARQHFEHARLRSVENGIPLIRAANSGVTAVVDSFGRTTAYLEEKQGVLVAECSRHTYWTPYSFWGNWGILFLCCGSLLLFVAKTVYDMVIHHSDSLHVGVDNC